MSSNYQRIQLRRGTITGFETFNPVLLSGEPAIALENGSGILKVGDGTKAYNDIAGLRIDVDHTIISGIAVFASGNSGGGGGDVSTAQFNIVSGISVYASGQDLLLTASSGSLNTSVGLLETSSGSLNTSVGLLQTASGNLNDRSHIVSGIAVFASGKALAGGGSGPSTDQFNIVSGIAVYASGNTGGGGDVSQSEFDIASGISVYSSGQSLILNTASGTLNTSVGLLETASGSLNTLVGLNTSNFSTLSGITTVSQSGNFGYHTYRSGGVNSSASGNISGVTNLVMVDQAAYNSLNKKSNTLYFIPE